MPPVVPPAMLPAMLPVMPPAGPVPVAILLEPPPRPPAELRPLPPAPPSELRCSRPVAQCRAPTCWLPACAQVYICTICMDCSGQNAWLCLDTDSKQLLSRLNLGSTELDQKFSSSLVFHLALAVQPAVQRLAAALARLGLLAGVAAVQGCKSTQNKYQHTFDCHISQRNHFATARQC